MNKQELENLKNLIASLDLNKNEDIEIGECQQCCTRYNGTNG